MPVLPTTANPHDPDISPTPTSTLLGQLNNKPTQFPDLCLSLSRPLLDALADRLPRAPSKILSIGSGTGLLENALLHHVTSNSGQCVTDDIGSLDIYGIEVATASSAAPVNKYLPDSRTLVVPSTTSLHPDALLSEAWMFVYPRQPTLLPTYLKSFGRGALEMIIWLGPKQDWVDAEGVLEESFEHVEVLEGAAVGLPEYEVLVTATQLVSAKAS